mmetsp:Transcript_42313/g.83081  ORF Transcript_42313/g.83081 Transcript_42313/m.83081 type:complete len:86 (+) Transcript_42313:75-332(+)
MAKSSSPSPKKAPPSKKSTAPLTPPRRSPRKRTMQVESFVGMQQSTPSKTSYVVGVSGGAYFGNSPSIPKSAGRISNRNYRGPDL